MGISPTLAPSSLRGLEHIIKWQSRQEQINDNILHSDIIPIRWKVDKPRRARSQVVAKKGLNFNPGVGLYCAFNQKRGNGKEERIHKETPLYYSARLVSRHTRTLRATIQSTYRTMRHVSFPTSLSFSIEPRVRRAGARGPSK